uniref:Uncharacterized protein n=1 Tax=Magallana gigas TaxID=29159 RepID=K1RRW3_MAGGI
MRGKNDTIGYILLVNDWDVSANQFVDQCPGNTSGCETLLSSFPTRSDPKCFAQNKGTNLFIIVDSDPI